MSHVYKPVMLLEVIKRGGEATKRQIAESFMLRDEDSIEHYRRKIVHSMPGTRLIRDGLLVKEGDTYSLSKAFDGLSEDQIKQVTQILEDRIAEYTQQRNPFGDKNLDPVPSSRRFQILKRAGARCELCGKSAKDEQIDVDHIVPRAKGGSNDISNLQALCRSCNGAKRDQDDTDFREVAASYGERQSGCLFCEIPEDRIVEQNELAYAIRDAYAVTEMHTLVIPKRHVSDYFDLHQPERNAIEQLLHSQREFIKSKDSTVTGFNVGVNAGESAGQTIFHCHVHILLQRDGDVAEPRGGVRGVIPSKQKY